MALLENTFRSASLSGSSAIIQADLAAGGSSSGWSDPTGLSWDYAWDFTAAAAGEVPSLVGEGALTLGAGSFSDSSIGDMSGITPTGLNLSRDTGVYLAVNTTFTGAITNLAGLGGGVGVHLRYICRTFGLQTTVDNRYNIGIGAGSGATRDMAAQSSNTPTQNRLLGRAWPAGSFAFNGPIVETAANWHVLDFYSDRPAPGEWRYRTVSNGTTGAVTSSAAEWTGFGAGVIELTGMRGDVVFLGVRQGTYNPADNAAAVTALGITP